MRAALLSKKTQSNFLLHLLFTWSEDNNSFFNQCRAFPFSPHPPVSSDTDTISIKAQVLKGRKSRQDDLENLFFDGFSFQRLTPLPLYWSCQWFIAGLLLWSMEDFAMELWSILTPLCLGAAVRDPWVHCPHTFLSRRTGSSQESLHTSGIQPNFHKS